MAIIRAIYDARTAGQHCVDSHSSNDKDFGREMYRRLMPEATPCERVFIPSSPHSCGAFVLRAGTSPRIYSRCPEPA